MKKIAVIGYKKTDANYKEIQGSITFDDKIGSHSIEAKVIRSAAAQNLRGTGKLLSHYRRVYILIGENFAEQINNEQERLMKTLKGDILVDILYEADMELLDIIREEMQNEQLSRNTRGEVLRFTSTANQLTKRLERDMKRYYNMESPSYGFGSTLWGLQTFERELKTFANWASTQTPIPDIKQRALERWYAKENK